LLAPVLVAVVPTVAIFLALARDQRRLLVDEASGATTRVAQLVAERNQRAVDTARGLLLAIAQMRTVAARDGRACSASLAPLLEREPIFINMGATLPDGVLFCSAAPLRAPVDVSDRAFYREAVRTGNLGVGDFVVSRVAGTGALGLGYPVHDGEGKLAAVAFVSLATAGLQQELDALELPPGAEVAVLDRRGVTLTARPDGPRWAGRPFDAAFVSEVRRADGPVPLVGTDGVRRLYDLRVVTAPDGTVAMHVIAGIPLDAVLDPVNRLVLRAVAWAFVAIALALAVAFAAAELLLVRRLRRVAEASRRIAAGDLAARTGLASEDEIGELAARFDDMAGALEALDRDKRQGEEQLRQAQKMEVVGQLAGGVAHDFNNLLTVVFSAASSLRERLPPGDGGQEDVREIMDAGDRAATLTRQLLTFSRRQHLAPRLVDLGATAVGMERMLRRVLGENVTLSVEVLGAALVHADPSQLEIALLNLAVNARDAMPRGGRLEVAVRPLAPDHPDRPAGDDVPPGPLVLLEVRDSGVGMDAPTRARIFEPFFTTKGVGRGTGLGLPIVQGVVAECGGAIRVVSEPGRGSEFRLYLPARTGEAREVEPAEPRDAPRGTERILVIEDDPNLRSVVRRSLADHGYAVRAVGTAADALALDGPPPDLVLTDVILPDGNGIDLARELAARWPSAGVLFMSGYAGQHLEAVGALPPDAHLLPKPFTAGALLVRVRSVLERRRSAAA
jgi:signal transduction histidine kinase